MNGASLRELVARLINDGKAYAIAEIAVVKATINKWLAPAKTAVPLVIVALLLVQAALTVLVAALGYTIAIWIGPAGGFAIAAVVALLIAGGLVAYAVSKFPKGEA
jgi:hypothetical protein